MNREEKEEQRKRKRHHIITSIKKWVEVIINPRFLLCFGMGWIITNGWAYILLGIGIWTEITWMKTVASAYLAILWLPVTPEKIITVTLALLFLRKIFPNDEKTLGVLRELHEKAKADRQRRKRKKNKTEKTPDIPTNDDLS